MPLSATSRVVVSDDQVSTSVGGEAVILGMHDGVYYGLDAVGARVWSLLAEPRTVGELVSVMTSEFDVEAADVERDLLVLLDDLMKHGLVREAGDPPPTRG